MIRDVEIGNRGASLREVISALGIDSERIAPSRSKLPEVRTNRFPIITVTMSATADTEIVLLSPWIPVSLVLRKF
jgi:hypothetical protein